MSWDDFEKRRSERQKKNKPQDDTPDEIAQYFAATFSSPAGSKVLDYLRLLTKEMATGPDTSACALRHLEGQRHLVNRIEILIARGQKADVRSFRTERGRKHRQSAADRSSNAGWFARVFLGR